MRITNLEKRTNVDIKAKISKSSCDHLCTSVVSILSHFSHQNTRATAFLLYEGLDTIKYKSDIAFIAFIRFETGA